MAAVLGASPFRSPRMVWLDKCGLPGVERKPTERMQWGLLMEPVARLWLEQAWDLTTERVAPFTLHRHDVHDWMLATPDDFVRVPRERDIHAPEGRYCVDYKIAHPRDKGYRDGQAPAWYVLQVFWQMIVTGAEHAVLVVLPMSERLDLDEPDALKDIGELVAELVDSGWDAERLLRLLGVKDPFVRLYHRDSREFADVLAALVHDGSVFWHRVLETRRLLADMGGEIAWERLRDVEPAATAADVSDLGQRYAVVRDVEHELDAATAQQFIEAVRARAAANDAFDAIKARICQDMQDARTLVHAGRRLATYFKTAKGRTFTPAADIGKDLR